MIYINHLFLLLAGPLTAAAGGSDEERALAGGDGSLHERRALAGPDPQYDDKSPGPWLLALRVATPGDATQSRFTYAGDIWTHTQIAVPLLCSDDKDVGQNSVTGDFRWTPVGAVKIKVLDREQSSSSRTASPGATRSAVANASPGGRAGAPAPLPPPRRRPRLTPSPGSSALARMGQRR